MVDTARILAANGVQGLREAVADAFDELSLEESNLELIKALTTRIDVLEAPA